MAIDASIALGIKPVQTKSQNEYMNELYALRNAEQTNQMNQMKMGETQRAQAQAEDTRNFFRTPGLNIENMNPAQKQMLASKNPELFEKLMTQQSTQRTQESETNKRDAETEALHILPYAAEYGRVNNRDEVISLTKHLYANPKLQNAPFHAKTLEQAIAAIPDDTTPEGKAALKDYASKNALGAKDYADKQLLSFAVEGGNYVGRNKITGAIVSSSPISLTAEQAMYAPSGLEAKQAKLKALEKQTADQDALIARTSGLGLPGTVEMLTEQQKSRTAEQDVLRGEIGVLQKQGQAAKNTTIAPIQLLNELDLLVKNGQGNSQRAKDVRGLIDKEKHIAEGVEPLTEAGRELAGNLVKMGYVPSSRSTVAINSAANMGVTADQFVTGKANIAGLTQVTKTESQTGAFENTFVKNAEATLQMGRRIGKSGVPIIDEYLANPAARASGKNPELAAYDVFIKGTLNEYAKIVSGSLGNTAVAQAEIKKMEKLLNSAQTTEQLENAVNAMITETRNRRWGFKAQKAEILGQPAPAAPVNKFNLITKVIDGKTYIKSEDGQWRAK